MSAVATYCSLAVLAVAAIDDVCTRRVHNVLLAALSLLSLILVGYFEGVAGLEQAGLGFMAGAALYFPLAWLGILGGGDFKLLAVVGLSAGPANTLMIGVIAIFWGTIMGTLQVALHGQARTLITNLGKMARLQKPQPQELHKMPFAVAMFLAGLTQWTLTRSGGLL